MQDPVQNSPDFITNCERILAWRDNRITPQALFELPDVEFSDNKERPIGIRYTLEEVKTAYKYSVGNITQIKILNIKT